MNHARHFADCIRGLAQPCAGIETGHKSASLCHLGNIAATLDRQLRTNPATETIEGDAEATRHLTRQYRPPWVL